VGVDKVLKSYNPGPRYAPSIHKKNDAE